MASGAEKLTAEIERLPLDSALKTAVLKGVAKTDEADAERHADSLRSVLDNLPARLEAVRAARARARSRKADVSDQSSVTKATLKWPDPAEAKICSHCGQPASNAGLEAFLGRLGITPDMVDNLRGGFPNVDLDEYLDSARTYLKDGSATTYAKENPGKVAAGVAALALGAGLIYAAVSRDRDPKSAPAEEPSAPASSESERRPEP